MPVGGLDRNTIILWLVTALIAVGGGSVGTAFIEPYDRRYGREGLALQNTVSQLRKRQEKHEQRIDDLRNRQGRIEFRQDECLEDLQANEDEHRDLNRLLHRMDRLEWDMDRLNQSINGGKPPESSSSYPLYLPSFSFPQAVDTGEEYSYPRLYGDLKAAMIEGTILQNRE